MLFSKVNPNMRFVKIWENGSPTVSFSAQDIPLNQPVPDNSIMIMIHYIVNVDTSPLTIVSRLSIAPQLLQNKSLDLYNQIANMPTLRDIFHYQTHQIGNRAWYFVNNSTIHFDKCWRQKSSNAAAQAYLVPYQIYVLCYSHDTNNI